MSVVLLVLQVALAGTFAAAAAAKLLRTDEFAAALRLSYLPEWTIRPLAAAVPLLETGLAFWLLLSPPAEVARPFLASAALLAAFTLWMASVNGRRLRVRCACFGGEGGEVGPRTLLRNALLLAIALLGAALASRGASLLPGPSWETAGAALSLVLGVALVQALLMAWPHLAITYERFQAGGADAAAADLE